MHDDGCAAGPSRVEVESGQRRVWLEGKAGEDPGREGKLGKDLECGWWSGKDWPYLRKAGEGFFICLFLLLSFKNTSKCFSKG